MSTPKIIKLTSQNVKRLSAVEITPDGNMIVIGGKNGQGKSSVLDSIMYALGGGETLPTKPVRDGQEGATITVDLGELIVKRTFTAAGGTALTVTNKDGARFPSPQAILDKLVGTLSFDPLEFARKSDGQAETLRNLVGLDFTAQDQSRAALYNERTLVNRETKNMLAQIQTKAHYPEAPEAELSAADVLAEQKTAADTNTANAKARAKLKADTQELTVIENAKSELNALVAKYQLEIEDLNSRISNARAGLSKLESESAAKEQAVQDEQKRIATLKDTDLAPFAAKAREVEAMNQKVRNNAARAGMLKDHADKQKKADDLTAKIDAIDAEKLKSISEAKFPIEGLSFDTEGNVVFNGIPLSQASSAEQTRVSIAIGLALNPKLRVLLIRDGSLLDDESLAMVADIAAKNDAQVWIERVSTGGEVSVVIEDGMVQN